MNTRLLFAILIGIVTAIPMSFAQQASIKGKVSDTTDSTPVIAANVVLLKQDSSFVSGTVSDIGGLFELKNIPAGSYQLVLSYLGYETSRMPVNHGIEDYVADVKMTQSAVSLQEVTIQARSVIQKADKKVVLPSQMQMKNSTGGIDLLQKLQLPRIFVDPLTDEVSTTGSGEVQLRVNGVQVTNAEIIALQPDDILRIEYHDDPGARYGTAAAVIDYIIRRRESGGNIKGMVGENHDNTSSDDRLSFSYSSGKSEISANADYTYRHIDWRRSYDEYFIFPDHNLHRLETGDPSPFIKHLANSTVNYNLTIPDQYFLNVRLRYNYNYLPYAATDRNSRLYTENEQAPTLIYDHSSEKNHLPALDIYFQRNLKNNQLLIFNVVGTLIKSDYTRVYRETQEEDTLLDLLSDISGNRYSLIAEGVYEKRLNTSTFTAGMKHTQGYTDNRYRGTTQADISMVQAESYVYAEYQLKKGKWSYMANLAGSRFYFSQEGSVTESFALLPSARIAFTPSADWYFRYRVNLQNTIPSLAYLNDVEQQIDPLQVRRGNPELESFQTLAQSFNAGYTKGILGIDLLISYNYQFNPIMESVFYENGQFVRTYENQRNFQTVSIEPTIKLKPWKNYINISVSPKVARYVSNGNLYAHTTTIKELRMNVDGSYKNWIANLMVVTPPNTNYFYGEQKNTSGIMSILSVGYKQPNWSLMAGVMNPFGWSFKMTDENRSALNPVISEAWNDSMIQKYSLRFSFNFDFGKQFKSVKRRIENKDEDAGIMSGAK